MIHYNLFFGNRVAALLTDGTNFARIERAQAQIGAPRLVGNRSARPELRGRPHRAIPDAGIAVEDFTLRQVGRPHARDAGSPDPELADRDGSRNDIGFTGGPDAPTWLE